VYAIFLLIDLSLAPVAGTENSDDFGPIGEANRQDTFADTAEAEEPRLFGAVRRVFGDHPLRVGEGVLGQCKGIPCLAWFSSSLRSSHSKLGFVIAVVYAKYG
jgi:hypothetical protein